jgi:hypothetical protein
MNCKPFLIMLLFTLMISSVFAEGFVVNTIDSIGVTQDLNVEFVIDNSMNSKNESKTKVNYLADSKKGVSIGLGINFELEECTQNRLMQRKFNDESNYDNIVKATNNIVGSKQDLFVNEALSMDKDFINEFANQNYPMSIQIYPYLESVNKPVNVDYGEDQLSDLFSKKVSIKKFIDNLWN